jgi:hypothetical protein
MRTTEDTEDMPPSADPMVIEANVPGLAGCERSPVSSAVHPTLETVMFLDFGPMLNNEASEAASVGAGPDRPSPAMTPVDGSFVNATCGASPSMLESGVIPTSPVSFHRRVVQPLPS